MSSLPIGVKKTILWRIGILRRYLRLVWNQAIACWVGNSVRYRQLLHKNTMSNSSPPHPSTVTEGDFPANKIPSIHRISESSSDLVPLKISLLGDCQIGKTSFLVRIHFTIRFFFFTIIGNINYFNFFLEKRWSDFVF